MARGQSSLLADIAGADLVGRDAFGAQRALVGWEDLRELGEDAVCGDPKRPRVEGRPDHHFQVCLPAAYPGSRGHRLRRRKREREASGALRVADLAREAEIDDLPHGHGALRYPEQVVRLDVPVHDLVVMQPRQVLRHLQQHLQHKTRSLP